VKTVTLIAALGLALGFSPLKAQSPDPANPPNSSAPSAAQSNQSWTGFLMDADCRAGNATAKCEVSEATKTFGFQTADGKYWKLDEAGSAKVRTAIDGSTNKTGLIKASVSGSMDGETLVVDSVRIEP